VRLAEHFAVDTVGGSALAPGSYVVGVHLGEFPDFVFVGVFRHGTVWAVGSAFLLGLASLFLICDLFGSLVKNPDGPVL